MSAVYLSSLELGGFRAYKSTRNPVQITLPQGPGLTMIVGSNGLGKSTVFDALEWALTGRLTRLTGVTGKEKEMQQAIGLQAKVKLAFSDASQIERTWQGVQLNEQSGEAALANWLVRPEWHGLDNLADGLHLTHFLGQSTRQLFIHKDGRERWNQLAGPAGLQALWALEQKLGRPQTSSAFEQVRGQMQACLQVSESEHSRVANLLHHLACQRELALADAALLPQEQAALLEESEALLREEFGVMPDTALPFESRLRQQQQVLAQLEQDLAADHLAAPAVTGAEVAVEGVVRQSAILDALLAGQRSAAMALAQAQAALKQLETRWQETQAASADMAAAVARIAALLDAQDCRCPVCQSEFTARGQLQKLAQESVQGSVPNSVPNSAQGSNARLHGIADERAVAQGAVALCEQDLNRVQAKLAHLRQRLAYIKHKHQALLQGLKQYISQTQLQALEQEVAQLLEQHKVDGAAALMDKLAHEIEHAKTDLAQLQRLRQQRDDVRVRLSGKNEQIRSQISIPLNASIAQFCAALMSDRKFDLALDTVASAASAQALLSFQLEPESGQGRQNPLLFLSEGQLAAVNLCLLLGASCTYPWSRWRALLLDDPLHHNDTIHGAAFIDVMRNLIQFQGYQVIVSTHDMEQAGYFLRKCANAGIASRYWHLYGRNDEGVLLQSG